MPIRTHRGRAAVYRSFWGWPVRSPKHLAGTVLLLSVLAVGLVTALPGGGNSPTMAAPSSSARANPFDPASRAAVPGAGLGNLVPSTPHRTEAPAEALAVANAWVQAFLTVPDGITSARWAEQMRPYTTEEVFPLLQSVDPRNVPTAQISGKPRTVASSAGKAEVDVPTTAMVVRLLLVPTPAGWRVASFDKAG
ncbi:MAG: hypothetical protein ACRDSP_12625 [Pseudonocardiaceae bacterium]